MSIKNIVTSVESNNATQEVDAPLTEAVLFHNRISQLEAQLAETKYRELEAKLAKAERSNRISELGLQVAGIRYRELEAKLAKAEKKIGKLKIARKKLKIERSQRYGL